MLERIKSWLQTITDRAQVLLADGDAVMRDLLVTELQRDGHEVTPFQDGRALLAHIETALRSEDLALPDLILSDVRMPGVDGLDLLKAIRKADADVPVVLITAFGDREAHARAFELGAVMIDKPFAMDALRATVRCLVW
jgi:two-component system, NtrC family, response regulator AtoC